MTNLKNFLDYNIDCPVCNNPLNFSFYFNRNKKIRFMGDLLQISMELNGFPFFSKKHKQQIHCYLNLNTNDFYIDFLDAIGNPLKEVSLSKLKSCQDAIANQNMRFQKVCKSCNNYNYQSSPFALDYKKEKIRAINISIESITLRKTILGERYKRFQLVNNFSKKTAYVFYDQVDINKDKELYVSSDNCLTIPPLIVKNYKDLAERLDVLVTFS